MLILVAAALFLYDLDFLAGLMQSTQHGGGHFGGKSGSSTCLNFKLRQNVRYVANVIKLFTAVSYKFS